MAAAEGAAVEPASARYNPFAFPSDTDFRFWLLITTILGSSLLIYRAIANSLVSGGSLRDVNRLCAAEATRAFPGSAFADRESWVGVFNACEQGMTSSRAGVAAGVAVLGVLALALYLAHPAWRRRRGRLVPLTEEDAPELLEELGRLSRMAGLRRPPAFVWNPLNMARTGVAYGTPGRRAVALTGGLATTLWTDPDVFRAVVLHELAHIRNGDLDKAYLTVAVWWAFVAAALLPFAVLTLSPGGSDRGSRILSLAALALVVLLLRNAALRAREIFADVRASAWPGYAAALDRILPASAAPPRRTGRALAFLRHPLAMHPSTATRRQAVRDTSPLFRLEWPAAAGVGFAGSVAVQNVWTMVNDQLAALIFAALVTAVLGLAAWRATFLAEMTRRLPRGLAATSLALAAGFAAGDALALSQTVDLPPGFALTGPALLFFDLVWYGLLFAGTVLFLRWLVAAARMWLPVAAGLDSPRLTYLPGIALAVPVLAASFWLLFIQIGALRLTGAQLSTDALAQGLAGVGLPFPAGPYLYAAVALLALAATAATSPLLAAVIQLLWALPLAAWMFRKRTSPVSAASWATMAGSPPAAPAVRGPRVRMRFALVAGLFAGGVFWTLSSAVANLLAFASLDAAVVWIAVGAPAFGLCLQVAVAGVVAVRAGALSAVLGIFAAFVCSLVEILALLAVVLQLLGLPGLRVENLLSATILTNIGLGTMLAVAAAGLGAALRLRPQLRNTVRREEPPMLGAGGERAC